MADENGPSKEVSLMDFENFRPGFADSMKEDMSVEEIDYGEGLDSFDATMKPQISSAMISDLVNHPLKLSSSGVTPDKENGFLQRGVRTLRLSSPAGIAPLRYRRPGLPFSPSPLGNCNLSGPFKRPPQPLKDMSSPLNSKRYKSTSCFGNRVLGPVKAFELPRFHSTGEENNLTQIVDGCILAESGSPLKFLKSPNLVHRSQSDSAVIMSAVERSGSDNLLVADCSKHYLLPIMDSGRTNDLKEISSDSLADLLKGGYENDLAGYEVIDCRYPFEFAGGHIKDAVNLYTQKQVYERYLSGKGPILPGGISDNTRNILIFHCEFSSKRGPDMCRFLRHADRTINSHSYPLVHYPEIYMLFGGYKSFFETHQNFCTPSLYMPMVAPEFAEELRLSKNQCRSEMLKGTSSTSFKTHRSNGFIKKLNL